MGCGPWCCCPGFGSVTDSTTTAAPAITVPAVTVAAIAAYTSSGGPTGFQSFENWIPRTVVKVYFIILFKKIYYYCIQYVKTILYYICISSSGSKQWLFKDFDSVCIALS